MTHGSVLGEQAIAERPPQFLRLDDKAVQGFEPQHAKLSELGLAICEPQDGEPKGAEWFVWKPLRPVLRSWLKMVVGRRSDRFRARQGRPSLRPTG